MLESVILAIDMVTRATSPFSRPDLISENGCEMSNIISQEFLRSLARVKSLWFAPQNADGLIGLGLDEKVRDT